MLLTHSPRCIISHVDGIIIVNGIASTSMELNIIPMNSIAFFDIHFLLLPLRWDIIFSNLLWDQTILERVQFVHLASLLACLLAYLLYVPKLFYMTWLRVATYEARTVCFCYFCEKLRKNYGIVRYRAVLLLNDIFFNNLFSSRNTVLVVPFGTLKLKINWYYYTCATSTVHS